MKYSMKLFASSVFLLFFVGCSSIHQNIEFNRFKGAFKETNLPLILNDTTIFENWPDGDLIDSNAVRKYQLLDKYFDKEFAFKNIAGYRCSSIGRFGTGEFIALIYKTYTEEAGDGSPVVVIATFLKDGKKIDAAEVLWGNENGDPLYVNRDILNLQSCSRAVFKSILTLNGILDSEIVPRKITETFYDVTISPDGKLVKGKKAVKELFNDTNPNILQDIL